MAREPARTESVAAARTSAGAPSSAQLAGPISSAPWTAASRPPPMAISSERCASFHRNAGEAGLTQDSLDPRFGRKRERPRIFRPWLRQFGHVRVDRLQRRHHPRIGARLAPASKCEPARRPQRLAHDWQRRPPARRRTSRQIAKPTGRRLRVQRDRSWHPRVRNRPAAPQAHSVVLGPALVPTHRHQARAPTVRPCARRRPWWRRYRNRRR